MELAHRLTSTRRGSIALAVLAALIAGILILVYVSRYRSSVQSQSAPVIVLVAKQTIPKGTSGKAVDAEGLYKIATIRQSQLLNGALSDPSSLVGRATSQTIYSGQQLTIGDFSDTATTLATTLTGNERAITIPIDSANGLIGQAHVGDHVDVYVGFNTVSVGPNGVPLAGGQGGPALKMILQDVPILATSAAKGGITSGGGGTTVTLGVTGLGASELAYASDNGKIWLMLRPSSGAVATKPKLVTADTLLFGVPPVDVEHALGGRG